MRGSSKRAHPHPLHQHHPRHNHQQQQQQPLVYLQVLQPYGARLQNPPPARLSGGGLPLVGGGVDGGVSSYLYQQRQHQYAEDEVSVRLVAAAVRDPVDEELQRRCSSEFNKCPNEAAPRDEEASEDNDAKAQGEANEVAVDARRRRLHCCSVLLTSRNTMKMAWQPQEEGLRQILTLLKESQSPSTETQRAVQQVSFFHRASLAL